MELILTQPGFAGYNEPLNLRKEVVRESLGVSEWADLHKSSFKGKLSPYIGSMCSGAYRDPRFNRPSPFSPFFRPLTRRIVFKIIHGAEEHINWLSQTFNGRVLFLVRHPIPVALSRNYSPKLDTILDTEFNSFFSKSQLRMAEKIVRGRDQFARNVLDWCLRNSVAIRSRTDNWVILTYEQLVVNPGPAISVIADRFELPDADRIMKRLSVPSRSTSLSNKATQEALRDNRGGVENQWLVEKWKSKVSEEQLAVASELVEAFELSGLYNVSEALPTKAFWI